MTEIELQSKCFAWYINEYPAHSKLLCYNNNNSSDEIEGMINKRLGTQRGRSDLVLYFDSIAYHIEIKTAHGEQSDSQIDWELAIRMQGFEYYIIRSLAEFQSLINSIIP